MEAGPNGGGVSGLAERQARLSCWFVPAPQRWAARTFSNETLVLDETTTSTGSSGMRLVVRRGVLRDGEGYTFTLTVLGRSGEEEGCASIRLSPNRPPLGGSCRLFPLDAVRALTTEVRFECTGECGSRPGRGGAVGSPRGWGSGEATVTREGAPVTLWRARRLAGCGGRWRPTGVLLAATALSPGPL